MFIKIIQAVVLFVVLILIILITIIGYSKFILENKNTYEVAPQGIQFVDIGEGEELAYQEIFNNAETTIVFIGGLSGWSSTWQRTMIELDKSLNEKKEKYNLIAIDLPPFGYSKVNIEKGFYRDVQASRINAFRKEKKLDSVIFVGHSYGAGPATEALMQKK